MTRSPGACACRFDPKVEAGECAPSMFGNLEVKFLAKRKGVVVRRGPKEA